MAYIRKYKKPLDLYHSYGEESNKKPEWIRNFEDYEQLKKDVRTSLEKEEENIKNQVSKGLLEKDRKIFKEAQEAYGKKNIFKFIDRKIKDKDFKDILNIIKDMEEVGLLK